MESLGKQGDDGINNQKKEYQKFRQPFFIVYINRVLMSLGFQICSSARNTNQDQSKAALKLQILTTAAYEGTLQERGFDRTRPYWEIEGGDRRDVWGRLDGQRLRVYDESGPRRRTRSHSDQLALRIGCTVLQALRDSSSRTRTRLTDPTGSGPAIAMPIPPPLEPRSLAVE